MIVNLDLYLVANLALAVLAIAYFMLFTIGKVYTVCQIINILCAFAFIMINALKMLAGLDPELSIVLIFVGCIAMIIATIRFDIFGL